jgi:hypothetical protein
VTSVAVAKWARGRQQSELAAGGTELKRDGVTEVVRRRAAPLGDDLLELGDYCVGPLVGIAARLLAKGVSRLRIGTQAILRDRGEIARVEPVDM